MTQSVLAQRAGISRQALGAIESSAYQPGVLVALKLASELGQSVEALFGEMPAEAPQRIVAQWREHSALAMPARVALGRVGGKVVAVPQPPPLLTLAACDGMLERAERRRARVSTYRSAGEIDSTLLIAGCDPAVTIVAAWLTRHRSPVSVAALNCSSRAALAALAERRVHAAGVHLRDPKSGEYNRAPALGGLQETELVGFARWELGLALAPGNPLKLRGFADFDRKGLRLVNRVMGSGARAALDEGLAAAGIGTRAIAGYRLEAGGHLEVAAAIAAGHGDAGVTIRIAAQVYGLDFIPLREERYDLVLLKSELETPPVQALLEALNSRRLAREVAEFCAYDTSRMGHLT
jgi:molybdate-binding protein/DNA-binding XRE family transcriptional regulator